MSLQREYDEQYANYATVVQKLSEPVVHRSTRSSSEFAQHCIFYILHKILVIKVSENFL